MRVKKLQSDKCVECFGSCSECLRCLRLSYNDAVDGGGSSDLTAGWLCQTVYHLQHHTVRQTLGDPANSSLDVGRGQSLS